MKRTLFILILALFAFQVEGQIIRAHPFATAQVSAGGGAVYTDDFEAYSDGNLDGQGSWILGVANIRTYDSGVAMFASPNSATTTNCAAIYDGVFTNNHYAEATIGFMNTTNWMGAGVRMSSSAASFDGYGLYTDGTNTMLVRVVDNSRTTLANVVVGFTTNDMIRLEISGNVLSCYKNGSLITEIDDDGRVTDSTLSTGQAGIMGYGQGSGARLADWEGGDL